MARIRKIEIQHFRAIQAFTWLDSPLEGDGFDLSVKIRPEENCGFPGLAIRAIVPQTGAK